MRTPVTAELDAASSAGGGSRWRHMRIQESIAGYSFILPAFTALTVFLVLPILASVALIFMRYDLLTPPEWVGLENIQRLWSDGRMWLTYWNSLRFVVGATFLNNLLGLMLAMGVNRAMPGVLRYLLRTAIFFPVLTTTASLAVVWQFLLTQDRGVVNYLLNQVGLPGVAWLSSSQWALISVIVYDVWKSVGLIMVLYLAGLQAIPYSLYEAAAIDGAGRWQQTRFVTLPLITPTAFFTTVISFIGAFQVFDNVWVLTAGGPGDASRLIVLYIYEVGFSRFQMGYASAISITLFLVLMVLTLLQFYFSRRWVHYE